MGLELEMSLDFDRGGDEVEAGSGFSSPGWYAATVESIERSEKFEGALYLTFTITRGPHKGGRVTETLFSPDDSEDDDKAAKATNKVHLFARRLGVWSGETGRQTIRWLSAVGKGIVIEVTQQSWTDKATGEKKSKVGLAYSGVYPPDHAKIPDAVRKALALPPARAKDDGDEAKPAPKSGAKKAVDYGSL